MLILNIIAFMVVIVIYIYGKLRTTKEKALRLILWIFLFWQWMDNFVFKFDDWIVFGCNIIIVVIMLMICVKFPRR